MRKSGAEMEKAMKWFSKTCQLDEMQELKLLKMESRGFWIGFGGCCMSFLTAAISALLNAVFSYRNHHDIPGALSAFAVHFFLLGAALSVIMCLCTALYRRRRKLLDDEKEEDT